MILEKIWNNDRRPYMYIWHPTICSNLAWQFCLYNGTMVWMDAFDGCPCQAKSKSQGQKHSYLYTQLRSYAARGCHGHTILTLTFSDIRNKNKNLTNKIIFCKQHATGRYLNTSQNTSVNSNRKCAFQKALNTIPAHVNNP